MQDLAGIKDEYKLYGHRGDWQLVANKLGKSRELVRKVMQGKRKNAAVIEAVVKLLDLRKKAAQQFQNS